MDNFVSVTMFHTYFVIGFGKQVHFSHRINSVIRKITNPDAKNTRNLDSVLKENNKSLIPVHNIIFQTRM